jgi:opacity protein-like surface antigen
MMKSKTLVLPLAAAGAFALAPLSASAAGLVWDPGLYLGGGIGYDRIEGEDFTGEGDDLEDDRTTYKGIAGLRFTEVFALEAQYIDFGTAEDNVNRVDADGWTIGGTATLPLFRYVNPYAKAGMLLWEAEGESAGIRASDDGNDFTYGVGADIAVMEKLGFRLEYERFELNNLDIDMASANLQFNF